MIPRGLWIPALGAALGLILCWTTGFVLVALFNPPGVEYVGPGFDHWNLPGTLLGLAVWLGASFYWMKKRYTATQPQPTRLRALSAPGNGFLGLVAAGTFRSWNGLEPKSPGPVT